MAPERLWRLASHRVRLYTRQCRLGEGGRGQRRPSSFTDELAERLRLRRAAVEAPLIAVETSIDGRHRSVVMQCTCAVWACRRP